MLPWLQASFTALTQRILANRLHHGMLLQGPQGLGKHTFATQLAKTLLCATPSQSGPCNNCQSCLLFESATHPDFHQVMSDKQIGVDQIRDAIKTLAGAAQLSGAKVLLIKDAHRMTESSANALLKTLEEPTLHTFLLLTTDQPELLLPTIKSRCEKFSLPLPTLDMTMQWAGQQLGQPIDPAFARLFAHRPLALCDELALQGEDELCFEQFNQALQQVLQGQQSPTVVANQWQTQLHKVLPWMQFWVQQQSLKSDAKGNWLALNSQLVLAVKQAQNPGINKVLLISQVLSSALRAQSIFKG